MQADMKNFDDVTSSATSVLACYPKMSNKDLKVEYFPREKKLHSVFKNYAIIINEAHPGLGLLRKIFEFFVVTVHLAVRSQSPRA